jgi:two-component system response regulator YesN
MPAPEKDTEERLRSLGPLLEFFLRVTGLRTTACVERKGTLVTVAAVGETPLPCRLFTHDPVISERCNGSDGYHWRLAHKRERHVIYECHAGLVDVVVPILGLPLRAGILTGQVLPRALSDEERERAAQQLSTSHTSAARLRRAFTKARFMPEERIEAAARLLVELTQYAIRPHSSSDLTPLRTYVASELLTRQQWHEVKGIARLVGIQEPPRIALAIQVTQPGWREAVDWGGLHRAREVVAQVAPSALAVVERDKLIVLYSDVEGLEGRIRKLLSALRGAGLRVAIGVGRPCDGERQIWRSYHEAETALGYRFMTNDPIIFLDKMDRRGQRSVVTPSVLGTLALLVRLGDAARAREIVSAMIQELGREPYSASWVLDGAVEILSALISKLREAGSRSEALAGTLRRFLDRANRLTSVQDILSLLEASAMQLIDQLQSPAPSTDELIERVCEHVQRNLAEPVRLGRLCSELLSVGPRHFSRVFRKVKGARFSEWLLGRRIEQAKRFLASTGEPVSSVAALCGYNDPRYFCRVFRKATAMTPVQYRRTHSAKASRELAAA